MAENEMWFPTFRVEQWLEHCKNIKCSQQENKMEHVAEMFGKKLGDVFVIRLGDGKERVAYFSEEGLHVDGALRFIVSDTALKELITGRAEIVEDEE